LVLARKYRPKNFKELIGQDAICEILTLALDKKQLSFAYLFSGLRGSGKTSTARIFAKALLCERGVSSMPCEECSSCKMANSGSHIDIIEIDAASNRRIDDIRDLIEQTKYKPAISRYKIFIIDEVHMLTKEAFNALLKTLEEPPEFVKFILATTDPLKVPATILSRTQHFRFRKIPKPILQQHLETILKKENIEFEKEAISAIVRFSCGSVRDALTLLDQAVVYSRGFLKAETITKMLGTLEVSKIESLIGFILNKDISSIREFISESLEFEAEVIIDELILYLKELLFGDLGGVSYETLYTFFKILEDAKGLLALGGDGEFVLAVTLFKMVESLDREDNRVDKNREFLGFIDKRDKNREIKVEEKKSVKKENRTREEEADSSIKFQKLIEKIYAHSKELGEIFRRNIKFVSFRDNILTWESRAIGDDKRLLRYKYGQIKMYVREVYGRDVVIKNNPSKEVLELKHKQQESKKGEEKAINRKEDTPSFPITTAERLKRLRESEPVLDMVIELFNPKRVVLDYRDYGEVK